MQAGFLVSFASVLCVAAVTTVVFQRLKLPVVLGYLLAGVLLGPSGIGASLSPEQHFLNETDIHTLAELGVILLMFSLGLEFSLRDLARAGPKSALVSLFEVGTMLWLGFLCARLLGFEALPAVFIAAMLAISSTTLIVRVFSEEKVQGKSRELVLGLLVFEDLIAILLLSALTTIAISRQLSAGSVFESAVQLGLYLLVALAIGLAVVPRAFKFVLALDRAETTLVAGLGLAFAGALSAQAMGYSVALGAFLAGSLAAQAGATHRLEPLVIPVRDVFAAVFFVAVGMSIEPSVIVQHPLALVVFSAVVVLGKFIGVSAGAFATGAGLRTSLRAGFAMGQIGEFSFIIAALARELPGGAALFALAVGTSTITALCTPYLVKNGDRFAQWIEAKMPHSMQTFVSLYASWIEATQRSGGGVRTIMRKRLLQLGVDVVLISAVIVLASLFGRRLARFIDGSTALEQSSAYIGVLLLSSILVLPLLWNAGKLIAALSRLVSSSAFPERGESEVDFANAPRRAFRLALSFGLAIGSAMFVLVSTQAFLPPGGGAVLFFLLLIFAAIAVLRSASELQGHVRAGAQALFEVLAGREQRQHQGHSDHLDDAQALLPGLGELHALRMQKDCLAIGQSLATLNVRGATGAAIILIRRGDQAIAAPGGKDVLALDDQLVLSGSEEAVKAAEHLLRYWGSESATEELAAAGR